MVTQCELTPQGLVEHYQSEDIYLRVLNIKQGNLVIGAKHLTTHLTVLLEGSIKISIGDDTREFNAPHIFEALAGSRKVAYAITNCKIMNILPTHLTNLQDIEKAVVDTTLPKNIEELITPIKRIL